MEGTEKLTILLQDKAFGTLQMTHSGSPTFKFNFSAVYLFSHRLLLGLR